ncbi:CTR copper uptake transporter [Favolaschia claudopus]|uniref:Copper transport protein n=1 Tax=Favolaschia claudopus TaxID=2862362 RepID=A0AAW0CPE8_9AGAR
MLSPTAALLLLFTPSVLAHGSSASSNDTMGSMMMTALHFTPLGDTLWFSALTPSSSGAVAGACIALLLLAIFDRYLAAVRATLAARWAPRPASKNRLEAPPFRLSQDLPRGALYALQTFLGFAFMLAVMTFQAAYIISVVVGLGVGEMLFGRTTGHAAAGH